MADIPHAPVWMQAPLPAVFIWREGRSTRWQLNEAASCWRETAGLSVPAWRELAEQALALPGTHTELGSHGLAWRRVQAAPGWVLWLDPCKPGASHPEGDGGTGTAVMASADVARLSMAREFGRIGFWERDLRSGQARWDAHIFDMFGLDPAAGAPAFEHSTALIHPDDSEASRYAQASFRHPGRYQTHFRVLRPDGTQRSIHSMWEVQPGTDGLPLRAVGIMLDDTDSLTLTRQMEAARTQFRMAAAMAGLSMWRHDLVTDRFHVNPDSARMTVLWPDEQGMPIEEARASVHPDDLEAVLEASRRAKEQNTPIDVEARYLAPGGGYRTLLTRRVAERDAQGRVVALLGVSLDISDQIAEFERLQTIAASMELIADATGVGVWSLDIETGEATWSKQMLRIFGLPEGTPAPNVDQVMAQYTHADDLPRLKAEHQRLVQGDTPTEELEYRIRTAQGEVRWVVGRARRGMRGNRPVAFGMVIDVTERRREQEALHLVEQRAVLAAQAAGIGTWEMRLPSQETIWDAQMYLLRGLSPDDPRAPEQIIRESADAETRARMAQLIGHAVTSPDGIYRNEFVIHLPDGTERWLASRGMLLRDDQGQPERFLGVNWDITDLHRSQEALQAKVAAEEANRAKSEFLARMSHELRTPLNAVIGFADLMLHDGLGEPQRVRAERIRAAGQHLLALIDDVLDLTSIDAGKLRLKDESVSLSHVVADALEWVEPHARRADVRMVAGAMDGFVHADARRLRQVMTNLLSNAVKYNRPQGRVDIAILHGPDPSWLGFSVRDTGRGLSRAQLANLFEPFNRLGAEHEGIEGTGIGLAIVHHLVEAMGGAIEVRSEPGEGTEFRVWLRAAEPEPLLEEAASTAGVATPCPRGAHHGATAVSSQRARVDVLYVEDNPVNLLLVQELLALRPAIRLHTAPDGISGVRAAAEIHPRLILLDLQLPDIHGMEVMRRIHALPGMADTTCVALSANAIPEDVAQARAAGFADYWTKPIDFAMFLAGIDRFLAQLQGDDVLTQPASLTEG